MIIMQLLMQNYIHKLRFRLDSDAPVKFIEKFKKLKERIEIGENSNSNFSLLIKEYCKLESNKNLPILIRTEGGVGGNNNQIHKQIRYKLKHFYKNENDIVLNVFNSDNIDGEKWTYKELDDIINSFINVLNFYMETECIYGCIELINKSMFT